jgi:hypothetical protein
MMGVEGWSCDSTNSMHCHDMSMKVTGRVTIYSRFFTMELSNNHRGWGVTKQREWGTAHEFCTCITSMKFSKVPQLMSADTGVSERRGMETVMINDNRESEEMVACKCTTPSDEETSVMWGLSGVELMPPEILNVVWAMGVHNVDVAAVLLGVIVITAGVVGVHSEWQLGQLSIVWLPCMQ